MVEIQNEEDEFRRQRYQTVCCEVSRSLSETALRQLQSVSGVVESR